jgi:hypothetical protein
MIRRVALVRTDVSEERRMEARFRSHIVFLRNVRRLVFTANFVFATLMMDALRSPETSLLIIIHVA